MTYEQAAYFKLLLLSGYTDELQRHIDSALLEQVTPSNIILELSTLGLDNKKTLSVLNDYLRQGNSNIDWDKKVFDMVISFLKNAYEHDNISMKKITDLMYQFAVHSERYFNEPWQTMYYMGDLFDEAEAGYIDKADFQQNFERFIKSNTQL